MSELDKKQSELNELRRRAQKLETEIAAASPSQPLETSGFYTGYYATAGFLLGGFAAMASLLFNVVGAALFGKHPLELIRVYLTFPLGDRALEVQTGLALAVGCCLYLGTGMLLGIPVHLALARWIPSGTVLQRLVVATSLGVVLWVVNYYGLLAWLQPILIDMSEDNLIVKQVPWWVGVTTHLVFTWTMALLYPLGVFVPYRRMTEQQ